MTTSVIACPGLASSGTVIRGSSASSPPRSDAPVSKIVYVILDNYERAFDCRSRYAWARLCPKKPTATAEFYGPEDPHPTSTRPE